MPARVLSQALPAASPNQATHFHHCLLLSISRQVQMPHLHPVQDTHLVEQTPHTRPLHSPEILPLRYHATNQMTLRSCSHSQHPSVREPARQARDNHLPTRPANVLAHDTHRQSFGHPSCPGYPISATRDSSLG